MRSEPRERGVRYYEVKLHYRLPLDSLFWRGPERADESGQKSWNVSHGPNDRGEAVVGTAAEAAPQGIKGFITALPVLWTSQESNNTEFALAVLANNELMQEEESKVAYNNDPTFEQVSG